MSRYFKDFQKCSAALPHGRTVLPALAVRPHRGGFCAPVPAGCPFVDKPSAATNVALMDLPLKKNLLVAFINRNGRILIPTGQDCIKVGDTVMIVTKHEGLVDIRNILE